MRRDQEQGGPATTRPRDGDASASSGHKLALSEPVRRALLSFHERGPQRRALINVLILAQTLLLLAAAPGYLGAQVSPVAAGVVALGLVVCAGAWVFNQLLRDPAKAAYVLVGGLSLAVLAQVYLAALGGSMMQTSQAALLWLTVVLEAGVLFAPEVTLITGGTALILTIVALLLALALGGTGSRREAYDLVVETLGLQVVTALIAWLLARFIYDSVLETQGAQDLQFVQVKYETLLAQSAEQRERLEAAIAALQRALGSAIHGELAARAHVPEGELSVVAASLNMVLERLEALAQGEMVRQRMEAAALPLIDVVGRVGDGMTPPPASLPIMTNTALDTISVAVSQMQTNVARRLLRVQELAGEVVGALAHSQQGLSSTTRTAAEALRTVGAAIAAADSIVTTAQREVELIVRARRALAGLLPAGGASPEAPREASGLGPAEAAALLGLGPDLGVGTPDPTGDFTPLANSGASADAAEAPAGPEPAPGEATAPAAGQGEEDAGGETAAGSPASAGDRAEALAELSQILDQLREEALGQERSAGTLTHELGMVNRNVRGVDAAMAWARQALEAVRRNAEKLNQTAGGSGTLPVDSGPTSAPLPQRGTQATRPLAALAESGQLPSGALLSDVDLSGLVEGGPSAGERAAPGDGALPDTEQGRAQDTPDRAGQEGASGDA